MLRCSLDILSHKNTLILHKLSLKNRALNVFKWLKIILFRFIVFNATFNNISVISWRSVLLVEEIGVPGEYHRPVASHWQTLSNNVVSSTPRHERGSNSQLSGYRHWSIAQLVVNPTTTRSRPRRPLKIILYTSRKYLYMKSYTQFLSQLFKLFCTRI